MSNKSGSHPKSKTTKKRSSSKSSGSTITSSLYSGVASAKLALTKLGLTKRADERVVTFSLSSREPPAQHYPWDLKYNQLFTRENMKKSMTKDSYATKGHVIVHANESITTEKEYSPVLISASAIHTEKPIIHGETKPILPNVVRYVRANEIMPTEKGLPQIPTKKSSISQLQFETKAPIPIIGTPALSTTTRLLNRPTIRSDASVIRKPPRRVNMNTTHETIMPLAVYG